MKARSREVNIFNMSLLDILSGALGAFCFMMLVLFPYYKNKAATPGGDTDALEAELRRTQAELQQAREEMSHMSKGQPVDVQQMMAQLKQAEQQRDQAEAAARQAEAAVRQAQAQLQQTQQSEHQVEQAYQKAEQRAELAKTPLVVQAWWGSPADEVNMYVRYTGKQEDGKVAAPFDPSVRPQPFYTGEHWFDFGSNEMWLIRDMPAGEYEVYYRLAKQSNPGQPVVVHGVYATEGAKGSGSIALLPDATLDAGHKSLLLGKLVKKDGNVEFQQNGGKK